MSEWPSRGAWASFRAGFEPTGATALTRESRKRADRQGDRLASAKAQVWGARAFGGVMPGAHNQTSHREPPVSKLNMAWPRRDGELAPVIPAPRLVHKKHLGRLLRRYVSPIRRACGSTCATPPEQEGVTRAPSSHAQRHLLSSQLNAKLLQTARRCKDPGVKMRAGRGSQILSGRNPTPPRCATDLGIINTTGVRVGDSRTRTMGKPNMLVRL